MASEERIRELAYSIWEKEGRPQGKDTEHYFRAKQILEEQEAASLTFKELMPPASALPWPPAPKSVKLPTEKRRFKKA